MIIQSVTRRFRRCAPGAAEAGSPVEARLWSNRVGSPLQHRRRESARTACSAAASCFAGAFA
jgi:hypothetical protein